ncbi:MAG: hypothetical protein AAFQ41_02340 [Cyanobacteria bacterium J06623_7]
MANLTEQDIRAIIRDELRKIVGANNRQDIIYLPTNEAYKQLGFTSSAQLRQAVNNGLLRVGKEVQDRRSPDAAHSSYYFNIPLCVNRLNTRPEKRKA